MKSPYLPSVIQLVSPVPARPLVSNENNINDVEISDRFIISRYLSYQLTNTAATRSGLHNNAADGCIPAIKPSSANRRYHLRSKRGRISADVAQLRAASWESIAHESSSACPRIAGKSNESSAAPSRTEDHRDRSMTGGYGPTLSSFILTYSLLSGPNRICAPVRSQAACSGLQIRQTDQAFGAIKEDQLALRVYTNPYSFTAPSVQ